MRAAPAIPPSISAGAGSHIITNISESSGWRAALLGTVAAGALWLGLPRYAKAGPDACVTTGTAPTATATCQGDQSDGISSNSDVVAADVERLNVNSLDTDITPASGVDGIYFRRIGAGYNIVINSDTTDGPNGVKEIIVNGAGALGIDAYAREGSRHGHSEH